MHLIDDLTYNYISGTNRLASITDSKNTTQEGLGDFQDGNKMGDDHDLKGNMTVDMNKNFNSIIAYNYLNLPETITFAGKGSVR